MANYFIVNTPSNLITDIVATSYTPQNTKLKTFIKATDKALDIYYGWCEKNPDLCPDLGEIVSRCQYLQDTYHTGKARMVSDNLNRRYR